MSARLCFVIGLLVWSQAQLLPQQAAERSEQSLFEQTLARDIATASFYELVAWLDSLGESTQGSRDVLAARIAGIYGVTEEELAAVGQDDRGEGSEALVIESASRTRYFSLQEIDEAYVRLSGDVVVTLTDNEQGARHTVQAQEIVFNRDQNTLSASGSVTYLLERDGTVERFRGEALTVRLDDFSGAFVRGITEREQTIEGREIDFDFSGSYITRSPDEVIVLEDGIVTSSQADPPNYYLAADRIWVLSPGEWGLSNAVLHVGRVPLFYFPFFFRPGDELFFNPAIGSRTRDGLFIQTTTYLAGTPPEGDTPLSILQIADEPVDQSRRVREGLFLVVPDESQRREPEASDDQIRVLIDLYTMLGAFIGMDGQISQAGIVQNLEFFGGIAVTRHLYQYASQGLAYSPYYITAEGARQSWNTTTVGPLELPFRLAGTVSGAIELAGLVVSLQFEAFSDARFPVDFLDRSEQIDWLGLLGQSEPRPVPGERGSLLWEIELRYTPEFERPSYLQTLQLQRLAGSLRWSSREIDSLSLSEEVLEADNSPQTMFFYPDSMRLPDISARVGGTLLELPVRREREREVEQPDLPRLVPPWEEPQREPETSGDANEASGDREGRLTSIVPPPLQPDLPGRPPLPPSSARISYTLSPTALLDHEFNDSQWLLPSDTDFSVAYRALSSRVNSSLAYSAQIGSSLVGLNGSLSANGQYRSVFDRDSLVADTVWESLELQAWSFSSFSATNTNTIQVRPLLYSGLLSESSLSHTIQTLLFRTAFDTVSGGRPVYTSESVRFDDPEFVRAHRLDATAVVTVVDSQRLQLSADLPPKEPRYSATADLQLRPFTFRVAAATRKVSESWQPEPVTAALALDLQPVVLVASNVSYDLDRSLLEFSRTTVEGGGFSVQFEARQAPGYSFGGAGTGWQLDEAEQLRPVRFDASYTLDTDIGPLWRNRFAADVQTRIGVTADLLRFTQSTLNFSLSGSVLVHEFLALDLSMRSSNDQIYVYVPPLAQEVGREPRSLFLDLWRSINFFSDSDRRLSAFNLQRLELSAIHDLGDWDLTVSLSVQPELVTQNGGPSTFELASRFSLNVQWRPIGELSSTIAADREGLRIGDDP